MVIRIPSQYIMYKYTQGMYIDTMLIDVNKIFPNG